MRRPCVVAALLLLAPAFAPPALADTGGSRPLPAWLSSATARCRSTVIHRTSTPSLTAGIRGAACRPEDLYWMGEGASPRAILDRAEAAEKRGALEEAAASYQAALARGATGRTAVMAAIGLASCRLAEGRAGEAARRLASIHSRADDADLRYAAALPLASALAAEGRVREAASFLEELLKALPDHPLSGSADSLLFLIKERAGS